MCEVLPDEATARQKIEETILRLDPGPLVAGETREVIVHRADLMDESSCTWINFVGRQGGASFIAATAWSDRHVCGGSEHFRGSVARDRVDVVQLDRFERGLWETMFGVEPITYWAHSGDPVPEALLKQTSSYVADHPSRHLLKQGISLLQAIAASKSSLHSCVDLIGECRDEVFREWIGDRFADLWAEEKAYKHRESDLLWSLRSTMLLGEFVGDFFDRAEGVEALIDHVCVAQNPTLLVMLATVLEKAGADRDNVRHILDAASRNGASLEHTLLAIFGDVANVERFRRRLEGVRDADWETLTSCAGEWIAARIGLEEFLCRVINFIRCMSDADQEAIRRALMDTDRDTAFKDGAFFDHFVTSGVDFSEAELASWQAGQRVRSATCELAR